MQQQDTRNKYINKNTYGQFFFILWVVQDPGQGKDKGSHARNYFNQKNKKITF